MKPIARCLLVTLFVWVTPPLAAQLGGIAGPQRPLALRVGEKAPNFKLKSKDGQPEVQLSSFKGQKPVILVFGSFT